MKTFAIGRKAFFIFLINIFIHFIIVSFLLYNYADSIFHFFIGDYTDPTEGAYIWYAIAAFGIFNLLFIIPLFKSMKLNISDTAIELKYIGRIYRTIEMSDFSSARWLGKTLELETKSGKKKIKFSFRMFEKEARDYFNKKFEFLFKY